MNLLDRSENEVTAILKELNLTDSLAAGKTCYLIGDKSGRNPKIFTEDQAQNFLQSGDATEEYIDDS